MKREKEITSYIDTFVDEVQFALRTKNLRQVILSDRGVQPIPTDDSELLMNRVIRLPIYSTPRNVEKAANAIANAAWQFFEKYEVERDGLEAFPSVMVLIPGEHNYIDGIFDDYPTQYEGFLEGQQTDLRADVIRILCDYVQVRDSDGSRKEGFSFTSQQYMDFIVSLWAALQNERVDGIGCISYSQHGQVVEIYDAISPFLLSTPATLYAPPLSCQQASPGSVLTYITELGESVACEGARYGYVLSAEYPLPQYGNPLAGVSMDSKYLTAHGVAVNDEELILSRLQYGVHHLSRAQRFIRDRLENMLEDPTYHEAMGEVEIIITSIDDALCMEGAANKKIDRFERLVNNSIAKIILFFERIKDGWVLPQGGAKITSNIRIAVPVSEKTAPEKEVFLSVQPMPIEEITKMFYAYKKEQDLDLKVDYLQILKGLLVLMRNNTYEEVEAIKHDFSSRLGVNQLINFNELDLYRFIENNPRGAQDLFVRLVFLEVEYTNLLGLLSQRYDVEPKDNRLAKYYVRWQKDLQRESSFNHRVLCLLTNYSKPGFFKRPNYKEETRSFIRQHESTTIPLVLVSALFDLLTKEFNTNSDLLNLICFVLLQAPKEGVSLQLSFGSTDESVSRADEPVELEHVQPVL